MAVVKPFAALRYRFDAQRAPEDVCCPPYDIISEEERGFWEARSPENIIFIEKPTGDNPYAQAAALLEEWRARQALARDAKPAFFIYAQDYQTPEGEALSIVGLFGLTRIEEYENGVVLPHENTLSGAKTDRHNLLRATNCQVSPIYCLYEDPTRRIASVIAEKCGQPPQLHFTMPDGVTHRFWVVDDPNDLASISSGFDGRQLFIADGHHRYETSLRVRNEMRAEMQADVATELPCDYVMMVLTDMSCPGLRVFPTHRVIRGLDGVDANALLKKIEQWFDIAPLPDDNAPLAAGTLGFLTADDAWLLSLRDKNAVRNALPERAASYCGLDVTLLHTLILEPLLGIDAANMARGENLSYTRSRSEAAAQVREKNAQFAFLLPPTRVDQIRDVSLDGEKMPQKSTYFYPKLITGLAMHELL